MEAPLLIAIIAAVLGAAAVYLAMRRRGVEAGAATQDDILTDLREAAAESDRRLAVATTQLAEIDPNLQWPQPNATGCARQN